MNRVIGIDFGTTTSVICYRDFKEGNQEKVDVNDVKYIKFENETYTPTMILKAGTLKNKKGREIKFTEELFGWEAYHKENAFELHEKDFKMKLISKNVEEQEESKKWTRKFFQYLYKEYTKSIVLSKEGIQKTQTNITYPAKFPKETQNFLKEAAEDAGFKNVILINEAQAAMAYVVTYDTQETKNFFQKQSNSLKIMLIDMGAGTTDIAVFEYSPKSSEAYKILGYYPEDGTINFGGNEIDQILSEFYKKCFGNQIVEKLGSGNAELGERFLQNRVKKFKENMLSRALEKGECLEEVPGDLHLFEEEIDTEIDRKKFEKLLSDYLPQFPLLIKGALKKAEVKGEEIDLILLTGGHSRWYFIKEMLKEKELNLTKIRENQGRILSYPEPHLVVGAGATLVGEKKQVLAEEEKKPIPILKNKIDERVKILQKSHLEYTPKYLYPIQKDGKWGYIDKTGKVIIACQWDDAFYFSEGFATVKRGKKYGCIDKTGKVISGCQWDWVDNFSEGLARVEKDRKYGYIDKTGKVIIACQWKYARNFSEGFAYVGGDGKGYHIDKTGKVIKGQWDWNYVDGFSEGLARVEKDGKYGYVDKTGKMVIECQFANAHPFSEGLAYVEKRSKGFLFENCEIGYIDKTGKMVIKGQWDWNYAGDFSEGLACIKRGKKYGYIDKTGKVVMAYQWEYAGNFSEGLAYVKGYGKYGYIDKTNKSIGFSEWDDAHSFREGVAMVRKDGKCGYIDKTGRVIILC